MLPPDIGASTLWWNPPSTSLLAASKLVEPTFHRNRAACLPCGTLQARGKSDRHAVTALIAKCP